MRRKAASDPDWMKLALWVAKPHEYREDREDIRQEALIGAWRSVQKTRGLGVCSENRAAVQGARWAVSEYLRRAPGGSRCREIECLSLEELSEVEDRDWEPSSPDFTGAVIGQRDFWEGARRQLSDLQYDVLWRLYALGQTAVEVARDRRCSGQTIWRAHRLARAKLKEVMTGD